MDRNIVDRILDDLSDEEDAFTRCRRLLMSYLPEIAQRSSVLVEPIVDCTYDLPSGDAPACIIVCVSSLDRCWHIHFRDPKEFDIPIKTFLSITSNHEMRYNKFNGLPTFTEKIVED